MAQMAHVVASVPGEMHINKFINKLIRLPDYHAKLTVRRTSTQLSQADGRTVIQHTYNYCRLTLNDHQMNDDSEFRKKVYDRKSFINVSHFPNFFRIILKFGEERNVNKTFLQ